jgi:hypothetical protein
MPIPTTARVGIGAILAAIASISAAWCWLNTRTYVALDEPVSFSRRYIKTKDFKINLNALYSILVVTNGSSLYCPDNPVLRTRRLYSVGGRTVGRLSEAVAPAGQNITIGPFLGAFESKPGQYRLQIELLSDASCLNALHPRLLVEASPWDYRDISERYGIALMISLFSGAIGVVLVILSSLTHSGGPILVSSAFSASDIRTRKFPC